MTACHYDLDKDLRRKGALRQEIQRLKTLNEAYQFTFDALCLAEEPQTSEIMLLLRSNQSIEKIADILLSANIHLHPAPLQDFGGDLAVNAFGGLTGGPVIDIMANQLSAQIVEVNQTVQTPGMPDQVQVFGSHNMETPLFPIGEDMLRQQRQRQRQQRQQQQENPTFKAEWLPYGEWRQNHN